MRPSFADEGDRFLPIWCREDEDLDMERIKAAKRALDLPFVVYPRRITSNVDQFDRVLAVGTRPPFACEFALISPRSDPAGVVAALRWVLTGVEDKRASDMAASLTWMLGKPVREISDEELASEAALMAYLAETD